MEDVRKYSALRRIWLTQILSAAFLAGFASIPANAQEIDCDTAFELHLPLIEIGLSAIDDRSPRLDKESYRRYVEGCDGEFQSETIRENVIISKFFTSTKENVAENYEAIFNLAESGHQGAMLMLLGAFHSYTDHPEWAQIYLDELVAQRNPTAILYSTLNRFDFASENPNIWPEIADELLQAIELGESDACYFLSVPLQNSRKSLPLEEFNRIVWRAILDGNAACSIANYYICIRSLTESSDSLNYNLEDCEAILASAARSGNSAAISILANINQFEE